ncbi:MAG: hypothetical protein KGD57_08860 [Candidatus Lokiarchaeota archaeon]|nr:hypothetical protein [Candidatus Lokiarchaeota archaeon]
MCIKITEYYPELSIILAFLGIIASVIMAFVYQRRKDLRLWFIAYINVTIGVVISAVNDILAPGGIGHEISRLFFIIGAITLFVAVFKEYFKTFKKKDSNTLKVRSKITAAVVITPALIITISLEVLIITFCLVSAIMSFRIYFKKKTVTHAFLGICLSTVLSALIFTVIERLGFEEMRLFALGMDIIFFNMLLVTAIVVLLDQKLIIAQSEKLYMKDKYSHDLGNIFHTISMAYELISMPSSKESLQDEMDILIKKKINEASDLVKFIRNL